MTHPFYISNEIPARTVGI